MCRAHTGLCCQGFPHGLKWHKEYKILVIATRWAGILLYINHALSSPLPEAITAPGRQGSATGNREQARRVGYFSKDTPTRSFSNPN